jgi:hypothetical protein
MQREMERIRGEFLEMPGLRLTSAQAARLCGVEPTICQAVLDALLEMKFLRLSADGTYTRLTDGSQRATPAQGPDERRRNTA